MRVNVPVPEDATVLARRGFPRRARMLRAGLGKRAMIFHGQSGAPGCLRELDRLSRAPARRMRALLVVVCKPVVVRLRVNARPTRLHAVALASSGTGTFTCTRHEHGFAKDGGECRPLRGRATYSEIGRSHLFQSRVVDINSHCGSAQRKMRLHLSDIRIF